MFGESSKLDVLTRNGATHVDDSSPMVPNLTAEMRLGGLQSSMPSCTRKFSGSVRELCVGSVLEMDRYVNPTRIALPWRFDIEADPLDVQFGGPVSSTPRTNDAHRLNSPSALDGLFYSRPIHIPPQLAWFNGGAFHYTFDALLHAVHEGDVDYLRHLLPSDQPDLCRPFLTPFLLNHRDSAGFGLFHHAVSLQGRRNIAVIDHLYRAGSDIGLFSSSGVTPLHLLARMARDDARPAQGDEVPLTAQSPSLYAFTRHLVCDLHASLHATDRVGETPMHVAAEHGHSVSVLQAMLERDNKLPQWASAKEVRNERG